MHTSCQANISSILVLKMLSEPGIPCALSRDPISFTLCPFSPCLASKNLTAMAAWMSSKSSLPVKGVVLLVAAEVLDRVEIAPGWIADGCGGAAGWAGAICVPRVCCGALEMGSSWLTERELADKGVAGGSIDSPDIT